MKIKEQKVETSTEAAIVGNTVLAAGVCKITNDKFSWVMEVDGRTILFNGSENADYFAETFAKLGYEIVWDRDKWQREW
jgi:hypothetical protein